MKWIKLTWPHKQPIGGSAGGTAAAQDFFEAYLAAPVILFLYCIWKVLSYFKIPEHRPFYIKISDIDLYSGMREGQREISDPSQDEEIRKQSIIQLQEEKKKGIGGHALGVVRALF